MRVPAWSGGLVAGALLAGCSAPVAAPAGRGVTILSLNPCTDAILAQVADPAQIRGISAYSRDAAQSSMDVALARRLPVSGGTIEEVLAARPDVVVTGGLVPPAMRAAYARAGLRLEQFGMAGAVGESEAQVRRMAALAGHRDRGEALVGRIEAALRGAAPAAGARPVPTLVWQGGGMVPGREALVTELLSRTGFASFSAIRGMRQADVLPLELVVANPPEVILVAGKDVGGPDEDRMLSHPVLARLKGVARFGLDPKLEWCGGPTIIAAARRLGEVRRALGRGDGA
jgi:iron complex transport system substrate-binding protein